VSVAEVAPEPKEVLSRFKGEIDAAASFFDDGLPMRKMDFHAGVLEPEGGDRGWLPSDCIPGEFRFSRWLLA